MKGRIISRGNIDKVKIVIILTISYLIIYTLTGLVVGYQNSPYSLKIIEILKNLITVFSIPLLYEFARTKLIINTDSKIAFFFISIFFFAIKIEYQYFLGDIIITDLLQYILGDFLSLLVESFLLTYLSKNGGYLLNFSYIIPVQLSIILLPIFPNVDWFIHSSLKYVLYILIFLFIKYEDVIRIRKKSKKQITRESPAKIIPIILCALIIVSFVAGFFPLRPVAVISNSMVPYFKRGDICIIKKITDYNQIRNIQVGDVIEYQLNDIYVLHRVTQVQKSKYGFSYQTKGDSNKEEDLLLVEEEQIIGKVIYVIPYLGYPSVWFSEVITKKVGE